MSDMRKFKIEGLIAATFTPMDAVGKVDYDVIGEYAEFMRRNGVSGVFICGTTGEGPSLSVEERMKIASGWIDAAPEGLKILVHAGHLCIDESKRLAAHAQDAGAWGVAAMAPFYYKPRDVDALVAFCAEVARSAPALPFYYYHVPTWTGVDLPMVEFLEAAAGRIPNLAGLKYTSIDLMQYRLCNQLDNGRFDVLSGVDELLLCALTSGARGVIGGTYNFAAPLYNRIIDAFNSGDLPKAQKLQDASMRLVRLITNQTECDAIGVLKAIMKIAGLDCGPARLPITSPSADQQYTIEKQLTEIGFFDYCCK